MPSLSQELSGAHLGLILARGVWLGVVLGSIRIVLQYKLAGWDMTALQPQTKERRNTIIHPRRSMFHLTSWSLQQGLRLKVWGCRCQGSWVWGGLTGLRDVWWGYSQREGRLIAIGSWGTW